MRYSGKKMKPIKWVSGYYLQVNSYGDLIRSNMEYNILANLKSDEIMGSWVEVK
jgi:hypothetical protein